jgi:hypothetical protein
MASIWKLNNADIYVDEYNDQNESQVAEINPINSTDSTFHQIFDRTEEIQFAGTVVGTTHLGTIKNTIGNEVTLKTDLVPAGFTVLVQSVSSERQLVICQTIDSAQATTAPVYRVTVICRPT